MKSMDVLSSLIRRIIHRVSLLEVGSEMYTMSKTNYLWVTSLPPNNSDILSVGFEHNYWQVDMLVLRISSFLVSQRNSHHSLLKEAFSLKGLDFLQQKGWQSSQPESLGAP